MSLCCRNCCLCAEVCVARFALFRTFRFLCRFSRRWADSGRRWALSRSRLFWSPCSLCFAPNFFSIHGVSFTSCFAYSLICKKCKCSWHKFYEFLLQMLWARLLYARTWGEYCTLFAELEYAYIRNTHVPCIQSYNIYIPCPHKPSCKCGDSLRLAPITHINCTQQKGLELACTVCFHIVKSPLRHG